MESVLKWQIDDSGDLLVIKMEGQITEHVVFDELLNRPEERISLNLSEVRRFTSAGIREWIRFVTALSEKREVFLDRCSPAMVYQLSMIANMAGNARVKSIMVPYQCPSCDHDQEEILELEEGETPEIATTVPCAECGEETEFDDIPKSYLAFVLHPVDAGEDVPPEPAAE